MGAEARVQAGLIKELGQAFTARRLQVGSKLNGEPAYKRSENPFYWSTDWNAYQE